MLTKDFEVLDKRFEKLVFGNVHLDVLHTGTRWAEGPAYFPAGRYLDLVRHPQQPPDAL